MTWCLSPTCPQPYNADDLKFCLNCGGRLHLGNRYRVMKPIAQGGFGRTFLAADEHLPSQPQCVVKQLFPQCKTADQVQKATQLFHQEAQRLDELGQHPQIPNLLAHFTEGIYQYLVQTYVEGQTLEQELASGGVFRESQIRQLLLDLLPVLQFIHDRQVIHRDVKPANIIRQRKDGRLMLVDFGASKFVTAADAQNTGTTIGSAGYAAPEQVAGRATFASDLYSLGVCCLYLLTGVSPIDLFSFSAGTWQWRDFLQTPIDEELGKVIDRLVEHPINRRYASAASVLADLEPAATPESSTLWSLPQLPQTTWRCVHTLSSHTNSIAAVAVHPNGRVFASGGFDRTINLWHLGTGTLVNRLTGHQEAVTSLAFSTDGTMLISGSSDGSVRLWHLHTASLLSILAESTVNTTALALALSPDGQAIVSGSDNGTIQIWQIHSGRRFRTLRQDRAVTAVAISSEGQIFSASSDDHIYVWDLSTGQLRHVLKGHDRDVNAIALTADEKFLVSGSGDQTVKLWDLSTHSLSQTLKGHLDWVRCAAVSNGTIASGSSDATLKLWQLATGKMLHTLSGHTKSVNALAFSPDGKTLVSGSSDRTLKIWRQG